MIQIENIHKIRKRLDYLHSSLNVDNLRIELEELKLKSQDPQIWQNSELFKKNQMDISNVSKRINLYDDCVKAYNDLMFTYEYYMDEIEDNDTTLLDELNETADNEYEECIKKLDDSELTLMLSNEGDNLDCIIRINAGAGGTESQDFAKMLARMYVMYCRQCGWTAKLVSENSPDNIGYKMVSIEVDGDNAFGFLKAENGVHRLVRVSPFNAQGKRMTSFASVFVSPIVDDSINVEIDESRISYDYFRSSGAGGQNVNKVNSGVRARYVYTDPDTGEDELILVENTETRDQPKNKENARRILKGILYDKELKRKQAIQREIEDSKKKIEWGSQIRSYVLDDCRVKDHRTNYEDRNVNSVLDGNIGEFIKKYLMTQWKN